ncbi:MAG: hypothetical protein J6X55_05065 [Victivallales bacterium]|nr:hypothetical protein [Victivallales bacterium]
MKNEWNDLLNPLTVKELRQNVNSNAVKFGGVILALGLAYGVMTLFSWSQSGIDFIKESDLKSTGATIFVIGTYALALGCLGFGGVLGMFRFARERSVPDLDVGNFIAMSPLRMAWGHLLTSLVMCLYVYGICLPSVVCAYYLQGRTLGSMMLSQIYVMVLVLALNIAMIWVGSTGRYGYCVFMILIGFVVGSALLAPYTILLWGQEFSSPTLLSMEVVGLLLGGMFFMFTIAELSAPLSNRLLPVRIYSFVASIVSLLFGIFLQNRNMDESILVSQWTCLGASLIFALIVTLYGLTGPMKVSIRVREKCPNNPITRFVFFLFSSVWGGGYLLSVAMISVIFLVVKMCQPDLWSSDLLIPVANMVGYMIFYVATFFGLMNFCKRQNSGTLASVVVIVFNVVPFLIWIANLLLVNRSLDHGGQFVGKSWNILMSFSILRYIPEMFEGMLFLNWKDYAANLIGIWLGGLSTLVLLPIIVKQFIGFHKPTDDEWKELLTPQKKL